MDRLLTVWFTLKEQFLLTLQSTLQGSCERYGVVTIGCFGSVMNFHFRCKQGLCDQPFFPMGLDEKSRDLKAARATLGVLPRGLYRYL